VSDPERISIQRFALTFSESDLESLLLFRGRLWRYRKLSGLFIDHALAGN
jgi:hypothetical protein